jgi:hypothetical protein
VRVTPQPESRKAAHRRQSDPLAEPAGGWPSYPLGGNEVRQEIADWIWSLPKHSGIHIVLASRHDASRETYSLAAGLLEDLRHRSRSPRKSDNADALKQINKTAKKLYHLVGGYAARDELLQIVRNHCGFFQQNVGGHKVEYELVDWRVVLAKPLAELIEESAEMAEDLRQGVKGAGHQRMHDRLFGDPRLSLAGRACMILAERCGSGAIKSTENGLVHKLTNHIWRYATALDPEDYNLHSFVKKGVAEWRRNDGWVGMHTDFNRLRKRRLRP